MNYKYTNNKIPKEKRQITLEEIVGLGCGIIFLTAIAVTAYQGKLVYEKHYNLQQTQTNNAYGVRR